MPDSVLSEPCKTAPARHAASLLVLRSGGASGAAVLMGMRGAGHRFMPNRLVFPGGAVDRADLRTIPASPLPPAAAGALQRAANPALAAALGIAAARELAEEAGLSLGAPPALDGMHYLCRAVTPPGPADPLQRALPDRRRGPGLRRPRRFRRAREPALLYTGGGAGARPRLDHPQGDGASGGLARDPLRRAGASDALAGVPQQAVGAGVATPPATAPRRVRRGPRAPA